MISAGLSERRSCGFMELRRKSYRYEPKQPDTGRHSDRADKGAGDEVSAIRVPAGMGNAETCGNGDQPQRVRLLWQLLGLAALARKLLTFLADRFIVGSSVNSVPFL